MTYYMAKELFLVVLLFVSTLGAASLVTRAISGVIHDTINQMEYYHDQKPAR